MRALSYILGALVLAILAYSPATSLAQEELVTADRIGRTDAPIVLTWQIIAPHSHLATIQQRADGFRALYEEWARAHPDVRIDVEVIPGERINETQTRLLEQARVGQAPDFSAVDSFFLPLFKLAGVLAPLNEFFDEAYLNDLFPFVRQGVTDSAGNVVAVWWSTDLRVLHYRTDLVPVPPRTEAELIETAARVAGENPGIDGYLYNGGRWEGTFFDNVAHFWAQGGQLVDDTGRPIFNESSNREAMLNMLRFLQQTVQAGASPARVASIATYGDFEAAAQAGTVAMFQGGHWQYFNLRNLLTPEEFAKWAVAPIPQLREDLASTGTGGWTQAVFTNDPQKKALAVDFIRSVYDGPGAVVIGNPPTRQSLFQSEPFYTEDPIWDTFRQFLVSGQARPGFPIYPTISTEMQVAIGEVLTGTKSPEQALDDAWARVLEAYQSLQGT
ncbi:MAG: extracellular solute-binding protein [Deinococcus sp.]|nr:extracellular solute-binding protein [Deinococcus sp.]